MRRSSFKTLLAVSVVAAGVTRLVPAAPAIDGTVDGEYGVPLSIQLNPTGFGDSNLGQPGFANGSEIDAAYGVISSGKLNLMFTGNLESNFNKLDIFIDSQGGGMNRLTPLAPNDQGNFSRMADDGSGNGLTFDVGFTADHWIAVTGGGGTPSIFIDYANLNTLIGNFSGQTTPGVGTLTGGNGGPVIQATWNNSNIQGVTSATAPNDAAAVPTGVEVSIPLADIGNPTGAILVSAFINGQSQDFVSNQVMGPLAPGTANLGEPRAVNFSQQPGLQDFLVPAVPEPASIGLLGLIGAVGLRRRRN